MENNKNHILIVDDDDRIRNLLKDYLSDNNYIVSTAENAEQAKKRITYLKFDIIILDVMMPRKDGFSLAQDIRSTNKEVPIIFLTAKTMKEDVLKGTFELDKELNYVVIANSKRLFAKITSFFESGFTSSPDVKLRGNLFDFFQD